MQANTFPWLLERAERSMFASLDPAKPFIVGVNVSILIEDDSFVLSESLKNRFNHRFLAEMLSLFFSGSTIIPDNHQMAKDWFSKHGMLKEDVIAPMPKANHILAKEYAEKKGIDFPQAAMELSQELAGKQGEDVVAFFEKEGIPMNSNVIARHAGDIGRWDGAQARHYYWAVNRLGNTHIGYEDQIKNVIHSIKNDWNNGTHLITFWNPGELADNVYGPEESVTNGLAAETPRVISIQFVKNEQQTFDTIVTAGHLTLEETAFTMLFYSQVSVLILAAAGVTPNNFFLNIGLATSTREEVGAYIGFINDFDNFYDEMKVFTWNRSEEDAPLTQEEATRCITQPLISAEAFNAPYNDTVEELTKILFRSFAGGWEA